MKSSGSWEIFQELRFPTLVCRHAVMLIDAILKRCRCECVLICVPKIFCGSQVDLDYRLRQDHLWGNVRIVATQDFGCCTCSCLWRSWVDHSVLSGCVKDLMCFFHLKGFAIDSQKCASELLKANSSLIPCVFLHRFAFCDFRCCLILSKMTW